MLADPVVLYPPGHALAGAALAGADLIAFQQHGNSLAIRHLVQTGYSYIHLVRTWEMLADPMTKVVPRAAFYAFRRVFFGMA